MMRNILIWLALLPVASLNAQSCLPGGITFTTQAEVDNFKIANPGCKTIEGSVYIMNGPVVNLDSLHEIQQINGDLIITNNNALSSIAGLQSLQSVGQNMRIQNNAVLPNLEGLQQLDAVLGDFFYIGENPVLADLEYLSDLDSVQGIFQVWGHDLLQTLNGLQNLKTVKNNLAIFNNTQLNSFDGLQQLSAVGGDLRIENNPALTDISALDHPIDIEGALVITGNSELGNCAAHAICEYLFMPASFVAINNNAGQCNSTNEVSNDCLSISPALQQIPLQLWPNPGTGLFYIKFPNLGEIQVVQLIGILGAVELDFLVASPVLDLTMQPAGVYQLRMTTTHGAIYTASLVKL